MTKRLSRNVYRMEGRGFRGVSVHFTRRGVTQTRFFSDRKYGGPDKALKAASEWRDKELVRLYPPIRIRRFFPLNKTGIIGILLERYRVGTRWYRRYRASWPDGKGGWQRRSFDVGKYGREKAFSLAIEARRQGIEELEREARKKIREEVRRRGHL